MKILTNYLHVFSIPFPQTQKYRLQRLIFIEQYNIRTSLKNIFI